MGIVCSILPSERFLLSLVSTVFLVRLCGVVRSTNRQWQAFEKLQVKKAGSKEELLAKKEQHKAFKTSMKRFLIKLSCYGTLTQLWWLLPYVPLVPPFVSQLLLSYYILDPESEGGMTFFRIFDFLQSLSFTTMADLIKRLPEYTLGALLLMAQLATVHLAGRVPRKDQVRRYCATAEALDVLLLEQMKSRHDLKLTQEELNPVRTSELLKLEETFNPGTLQTTQEEETKAKEVGGDTGLLEELLQSLREAEADEDYFGEIHELNLEQVQAKGESFKNLYMQKFVEVYGAYKALNALKMSRTDKPLFLKIQQAQEAMTAAKLRGQRVTRDDFKSISQESLFFREDGRSAANNRTVSFYAEEGSGRTSNNPFDLVIREQVFRLLKYQGSLGSLARSNYFVGEDHRDHFFYFASQKVPFYFTYYSCEAIQDALMAKYLENPFNPVTMVSYGDSEAHIESYDPNDADYQIPDTLRRHIYLNTVYRKFETQSPNLLSFGDPKSNKSTLLNDIFGLEFEVIHSEAIGLFHDSVDAVFSSKEQPSGINVLDFQGLANLDVKLIETLAEGLPRTGVVLQISSAAYCDRVIGKLSAETRARLVPKLLILVKTLEPKSINSIRRKVLKLFPGIKLATQWIVLEVASTAASMSPAYQSACVRVFEAIQERFLSEAMTERWDSEEAVLKTEVAASQQASESVLYEGTQGSYWLLEDSLRQQTQAQSQVFTVHGKPLPFRQAHARVKNLLKPLYEGQGILARDQVFPFYMKELSIMRLRKKLADREQLSAARLRELEGKLEALQNATVEQSDLFSTWLDHYTREDDEIVDDLLRTVQSFYLPPVQRRQDELNSVKKQIEQLEDQVRSMEDQNGNVKSSLDAEGQRDYTTKKEQLQSSKQASQSLLEEIEKLVLDSELFIREAKQVMLGQPVEMRRKFFTVTARAFESGRAMEIIDGDIDSVEPDSLSEVIAWVQGLKRNNNKLMVVTVIGPQSSGKSTLMNLLFGAKFQVSAGRCTKGLNAMLIRVNMREFREILVLDSEGLFSIERNDTQFDRSLAIFCLTISNLLLINIKGELSQEIQNVLTVAVYSLARIAQTKSLLKKARIHLILRDQIEQSSAQMTVQYNVLKQSLREAASAAGSNLDDLMDLPDDPTSIISMFTSALEKVAINNSQQLVQTRSSAHFRQSCNNLRIRIIDMGRSLPAEVKVVNLGKWSADVIDLWAAAKEHPFLLQIKDLSHINDHRRMIEALSEFRTIMETPASEANRDQVWKNPLLLRAEAADDFSDDKVVQNGQTARAIIDKSVQDRLRQVQGRGMENSPPLENVIEDDLACFDLVRETLLQKYTKHVQHFCKSMGPDVQLLATRSMSNIVQIIYDEALQEWQDTQALLYVDCSVRKAERALKEAIFDSKLHGVEPDQLLIDRVQEQSKGQSMTYILKTFFKSEDGLRQAAVRRFQETAQEANKANDSAVQTDQRQPPASFKIIQPTDKCLNSPHISLTPFETGDRSELEFFARPNSVWLDAAVTVHIKRKEGRYLDEHEKASTLKRSLSKAAHKFLNNEESLLKSLGKARAKREQVLQELKAEVLDEITPIIWNEIRDKWDTRLTQIQEVLAEIQAFNRSCDEPQQLPSRFIDQLISVFSQELVQQGSDMKTRFVKKTRDLCTLVYYGQQRYIDAFNQLIFNQLLGQAHRNQEIRLRPIKARLEMVQSRVADYPGLIKKQIETDRQNSTTFIDFLLNQVIFYSLQKAHLTRNREELVQRFETQDLDYEHVGQWLHGKSEPSSLAQVGFKGGQEAELTVTSMRLKYSVDRRQALTSAIAFLEQVNVALKDKGDLAKALQPQVVGDFIKYAVMTLCRDILETTSDADLSALRDKCEKHQLFPEEYTLPAYAPKLFDCPENPRSDCGTISYLVENHPIIDLAEQLSYQIANLDLFLRLAERHLSQIKLTYA